MEKYRKVEIFIKDEWVSISFMELQKGDVFRLFDDMTEPDPIETGDPLVAMGDPYLVHDIWTIECEKETNDKIGIDSTVNG